MPAAVEVAFDDDHRVAGFLPSGDVSLPVRRALMPVASRATPPTTAVFTLDTEFGARLLVEVVRGCPNLCRFCWAGHSYLPVRPFDADAILRAAEAARPKCPMCPSGAADVGAIPTIAEQRSNAALTSLARSSPDRILCFIASILPQARYRYEISAIRSVDAIL